MKVRGREVVDKALEMRVERKVVVWRDSFPPFRIAALPTQLISSALYWTDERPTDQPDLIARAVMLTTTSGRASKMTNNTPRGQVTR